MTNFQFTAIIVLMSLSIAFWLIPSVVGIIRKILAKSSMGSVRKSGISRMLIFSACLIGSVWCLRYAVGYYGIITSATPTEELTWGEEIFNSLLHALQTFSMDEDYTEYILGGKFMLRGMFGDDTPLQAVYGIYASVLNFVAPIAGGAVIFEILASIFPKIKLAFSLLMFWKPKYYFSELNDSSLALAKSIAEANKASWKAPVIVFTDAYIDDESEKDSETIAEAKRLGAICLKDDIAYVKKNRLGVRKFFLIDAEESNNLRAFINVTDDSNISYLQKTEIYLFVNSDAYVKVEKSVHENLVKALGAENIPTVIPVKTYRNLICNLLVEYPLYEPLIGKAKNSDGKKSLNVTILGTGDIGTEMFLSTYWFGQILDCNLNINLISSESEKSFWNRIDHLNPEIKRTMMVINSDGSTVTNTKDPILNIYSDVNSGDVERSPYYGRVRYQQCDAKSSEFMKCFESAQDSIFETDYFLVALGSDDDNILIANTINRNIAHKHYSVNNRYGMSANGIDRKIVLAYVVFDPDLADTLNKSNTANFIAKGLKVHSKAVGNLRDVNSVKNVFMDEYEKEVWAAHEAYVKIQNAQKEDEVPLKINEAKRAKIHTKRLKDDYNYWSSLARRLHFKYKIFSTSEMFPQSVTIPSAFDHSDAESYKEAVQKSAQNYVKFITGTLRKDRTDDEKKIEFLHKLAWLEHRRWCAFLRTQGFRYTSDYDSYAKDVGSYKQLDVKLHPCLVECDMKGIRAEITSKCEIKVETTFRCSDRSDFDLLDELSYDLRDKNLNDYDFKLYDYPISDFQL